MSPWTKACPCGHHRVCTRSSRGPAVTILLLPKLASLDQVTQQHVTCLQNNDTQWQLSVEKEATLGSPGLWLGFESGLGSAACQPWNLEQVASVASACFSTDMKCQFPAVKRKMAPDAELGDSANVFIDLDFWVHLAAWWKPQMRLFGGSFPLSRKPVVTSTSQFKCALSCNSHHQPAEMKKNFSFKLFQITWWVFMILKYDCHCGEKIVHSLHLAFLQAFRQKWGSKVPKPGRWNVFLCTKIAWSPSFVLKVRWPQQESPWQWSVIAVKN